MTQSEHEENAPDPVIDTARLMDEVRDRVAHKRTAGVYENGTLDLMRIPLELESAADRAAASAIVVGRRETMFAKHRVLGFPVELARRAIVKLVAPFLSDIVRQINSFHVETVNELRRLRARVAELEATTRRLNEQLEAAKPESLPPLEAGDEGGRAGAA